MTGHPLFRPVRPSRVPDEIIAQVRARLRRGELRPGDRLPSERELAEQFDVSRTSVREALRMLEVSGLVAPRAGATGGIVIARSDPALVARSLVDSLRLAEVSLADITEARVWLESIVARVACERVTEAHYAALEGNVAEAERLTGPDAWERRVRTNLEFHRLLAEATGSPLLVIVMRSLLDVLLDIFLKVKPTRDDFVIRSRHRLLALLKARDAEGAALEMERYLRGLHELWPRDALP
ncbi:FadR/GntR family transcriptional regulator [Actinomadura sp. LOL_016]|uniref:FadR/GntR family transcriptional regulator n=1 Tax=unclassified Actinomadura TaxID=2626254 RepID=UPI003A80B299